MGPTALAIGTAAAIAPPARAAPVIAAVGAGFDVAAYRLMLTPDVAAKTANVAHLSSPSEALDMKKGFRYLV